MSAEPETSQADLTQAIREEVHREFAIRLVQAEVRLQAAQAGIEIPADLMDLIDSSKLLGEGGQPSQEAIDVLLSAVRTEPVFAPLVGAGHHRGGTPTASSFSLDARRR
ncbi:hypothetical protein KSE_66130 [Kitasatospora setae KM-6054]|uniref:Uncharacterized protein n=1 Tax=Kitasatospora setae (strain ATCC 33774 / DSM 43861 / JCM 3304 / KCC A-0304 / NBRC 14216 / KM-6054) TaxID=452652 RepID=E4N2I8_KITSK|nr:hypothetical protein KSE_66130 [Kitasatospora setae KM-6054]